MFAGLSNLSLRSLSNGACSLFDHENFKCVSIRSSFINSCIHAQSGTPCSDNHSKFVKDTEYTQTVHSKPLPLVPDSGLCTDESITHLLGYVSPKRVDYFIWEFGFFKEGEIVSFGDDKRLAKITRVEGVGCNFIKFGMEPLDHAVGEECPVRRMIVSSPDNFHLTHFQCFKLRYLRWFLKLMKDIADEHRDWDDSEMMGQGNGK